MGYRESGEIESYISRDPLEILRNKLIMSRGVSEINLEKLAKQINNYTEIIFLRMLNQNQDFLSQFEMIK
jgi:TPP-dependent pyruvate/acetoin dehydrogenase alpha subunit